MSESKLTDKALRARKPDIREQLVSDGGGLWARILPVDKGGAVNFYYRFELGGRERRFNCGTYPDTSLARARLKRNAARELVRKGIDPVDRLHAERQAELSAAALRKMEKTVRELFQDWKRVYLSAHRRDGGEEVEATLEHDALPYIGDMKAKEVRLAHVVQIIDRVLDRNARRKANLVLSLLRQMFRHGMRRGFLETDPTLALTRKDAGGVQPPGQRHLTTEEISELAAKFPDSGLAERYRAAAFFLLATGARVGELVKAQWEDVDLKQRLWRIPAEHSKNGRQHLVHLSPFALRNLALMGTLKNGSFLLPGHVEGSRINEKTISKAIRDRVRPVPLKNRTSKTQTLHLSGGEWSPHDLRRTFASRLGDLGIAPHVIERCLNHAQNGLVGVYQRQEYLSERRDAFNQWGRKLSKLVAKRPS